MQKSVVIPEYQLPVGFTEGLTIEINSGNFIEIYGHVETYFVYAAKAPYSNEWNCRVSNEEKFPFLTGKAASPDFTESIAEAIAAYQAGAAIFS